MAGCRDDDHCLQHGRRLREKTHAQSCCVRECRYESLLPIEFEPVSKQSLSNEIGWFEVDGRHRPRPKPSPHGGFQASQSHNRCHNGRIDVQTIGYCSQSELTSLTSIWGASPDGKVHIKACRHRATARCIHALQPVSTVAWPLTACCLASGRLVNESQKAARSNPFSFHPPPIAQHPLTTTAIPLFHPFTPSSHSYSL